MSKPGVVVALRLATVAAAGLLVGCAGPEAAKQARQNAAAARPIVWNPCAFDPTDDGPILDDVATEIDREWPGVTAPKGLLAAFSGARPLTRFPIPGIPTSCDGPGPCEIPVLISLDSKDNCIAALAFPRFCVGKNGQGEKPERITFVLANLVSGGTAKPYSPITGKDFQFVARNNGFPLVGSAAIGVDLHELHTGLLPARKRRNFTDQDSHSYKNGKEFFMPVPPPRNWDGLSFSWKVGKDNTADPNRPRHANRIGRVAGAVMAIPMVVDNRVGKAPNTHCKPVDPMIVNVAN